MIGKTMNILLEIKSLIVAHKSSQNVRLSSSSTSSDTGSGVAIKQHMKIIRNVIIDAPIAAKNSHPVIDLIVAPPTAFPTNYALIYQTQK